jgi:hypothetical protein
MGKIQIPRKLRVEDFKSDQQDIVGKIGDIYNSFVEEVYNVLNKRIDYDNLNRELKEVTVLMNASGSLASLPQIKTAVNGKIKGISVLNAINLINPNTYPTSAPFVSWTINGNIITILNITGLQANSEYKLTLEIIV